MGGDVPLDGGVPGQVEEAQHVSGGVHGVEAEVLIPHQHNLGGELLGQPLSSL